MTTFDEDADDAMRLVNGAAPVTKEAMIRRLDEILLICARAGLPHGDDDSRIDVEPAWDYLDHLALTPGMLAQLLVHLRWPIAEWDASQQEKQFAAEAAALLGPVAVRAEVPLPMTCPSPDEHARHHAGNETTWRLRNLFGRQKPEPDGTTCAYCGKPLPKSHRRDR